MTIMVFYGLGVIMIGVWNGSIENVFQVINWQCFLCSNNNNNNDINTFICQVCMLTEENVSMPDDEMFWMHCSVCMHMFHQSCVPSNIFTNYQRCLAISRQWVCGRCPENWIWKLLQVCNFILNIIGYRGYFFNLE